MRNTTVHYCLNSRVLRYIRDNQPLENDLLAYLGSSETGCYHVLRKERLLLLDNGRVLLAPKYCTADGKFFLYGCVRMHLDDDQVDIFCSQ